ETSTGKRYTSRWRARERRKMRRVPWTRGKRRRQCPPSGGRAHQEYGLREDDRQLLALLNNPLRLHSARHAVQAAQIPDERGSLRADSVHSLAKQIDRGERY